MFLRSIRLVPTQSAYVVERLGQYSKTLNPGFHALVPFIDRVAFIRDLKEETVDVPGPRSASPATRSRSRWTASSTFPSSIR